MSAIEENNNKENYLKLKAPLYFSPYSNKKHNLGNLYTEPRNIHQEIDSNLSKNQIKQKINNGNISKNILNFQRDETFKKNTKLLVEITDKMNQNKKNPQSYKKVSSKLYLKKNAIPNISALSDINSNILPTQPNTNSNTNINNISNEQNNNYPKNKLTNIKFNIGKSSQNVLNSKNSVTNLKKNAGSAVDLIENNNILRKSKAKSKNIIEINNINPIDYIYSSGSNQKSFLSPPNNGSNPKILFLKKEKSNYFDQNTSKDSKVNQTQENEQNNNDGEDKKNKINCLLRNTFTNVKIYPTTILNNKIIYNKVDKNNQNKSDKSDNQSKNNKGENSNNNSMHHNNSKIKKEKIIIDTAEKKPINKKNENFQSIEELHYFYVDTLQRGKKYAIKLDK